MLSASSTPLKKTPKDVRTEFEHVHEGKFKPVLRPPKTHPYEKRLQKFERSKVRAVRCTVVTGLPLLICGQAKGEMLLFIREGSKVSPELSDRAEEARAAVGEPSSIKTALSQRFVDLKQQARAAKHARPE